MAQRLRLHRDKNLPLAVAEISFSTIITTCRSVVNSEDAGNVPGKGVLECRAFADSEFAGCFPASAFFAVLERDPTKKGGCLS